MINRHEFLWSIHRALLCAITASTRCISADLINDSLHLRIYLDRRPTEDDWDNYYGVSGEIQGDFNSIVAGMVEIIYSTDNLEKLKQLSYLIYMRAEIDGKMVL